MRSETLKSSLSKKKSKKKKKKKNAGNASAYVDESQVENSGFFDDEPYEYLAPVKSKQS